MIKKLIFLLLGSLAWAHADVIVISLNAAPFNEQDQTGDRLKDSYGNDLDDSFVASLGYFDNNFSPNSENIGDWRNNWVSFTQSLIVDTNPPFAEPRFNLEAEFLSDGTSSDNADAVFSGQSAWLWVYNEQDAFAPGAEWFLGRVESWMFPEPPEPGCTDCPGEFPTQWAVSNFSTETPIWGRQSSYEGGGFNFTSEDFTLQTYVVIPEPGSLFLMLAAFSAASLLLYRRKGAAQ